MIDTVAIWGPWPLREALPPRELIWLRRRHEGGVRIRVDAVGRNVAWVEASLPGLLYGNNGRLLTNQGELDAALGQLRSMLLNSSEVPPVEQWRVKRLDLCWNFDLPARAFIFAHAVLTIPRIRNLATLFGGGCGVSWRGARSRFMVTLYDKSRESGTAGDVLRAEVRLGGEHLHGRFPNGEWRQFSALWRVYRGVMSTIPAIPDPKLARDWQTAVGMEEPEIRNRIMGRLAEHNERTFRRWRARVESAQMPGSFRWSEFLPHDAPPKAVHVSSPAVRRPG